MPTLPCFICGNEVDVRLSKRNKPYITCDACGCQLFIRYGKSEQLILAKIKEYQSAKNGGQSG
jgi:hypothetical protein